MHFTPRRSLCGIAALLVFAGMAHAQDDQAPAAIADPAELAFEQGRWEEAIAEYREILAAYPEDRLSFLRIAQAQRELKRHDEALTHLKHAGMTDF